MSRIKCWLLVNVLLVGIVILGCQPRFVTYLVEAPTFQRKSQSTPFHTTVVAGVKVELAVFAYDERGIHIEVRIANGRTVPLVYPIDQIKLREDEGALPYAWLYVDGKEESTDYTCVVAPGKRIEIKLITRHVAAEVLPEKAQLSLGQMVLEGTEETINLGSMGLYLEGSVR